MEDLLDAQREEIRQLKEDIVNLKSEAG